MISDMGTIVYVGYTVAHLVVACWALWLWRVRGAPGAIYIALLSVGYTYGALIVALGRVIRPGEVLEGLSRPRFYAAAVLTPLVMMALLKIGVAADLKWADRRISLWLCLGTILTLILIGIFTQAIGVDIQAACYLDTIRYTVSTPLDQLCVPDQVPLSGVRRPIAVIAVGAFMLVVGLGVMLHTHWPWLFVGGALLPLYAMVVPLTPFDFAVGAGQVLLSVILASTSQYFSGARSVGPRLPRPN